MSNPVNISGFVRVILILFYSPALWRNPPYKDKATKAALPIANPLPIAAVVFPAASSPSVIALTYYPI